MLPRQWRFVPWLLVILNGLARIYVGAHNPLDIVGGIGAGLIIAAILNAALLPERDHTWRYRTPSVEPSQPLS